MLPFVEQRRNQKWLFLQLLRMSLKWNFSRWTIGGSATERFLLQDKELALVTDELICKKQINFEGWSELRLWSLDGLSDLLLYGISFVSCYFDSFFSEWSSTIFPKGHEVGGEWSSLTITMSFKFTAFFANFHLFRCWRVLSFSFLQLFQNLWDWALTPGHFLIGGPEVDLSAFFVFWSSWINKLCPFLHILQYAEHFLLHLGAKHFLHQSLSLTHFSLSGSDKAVNDVHL